ncbi:MAG: Hsp33 family molecular chaperone HslO [Betaproteobacteria bacterium]|nr:Hsp33 family molecular chaperone HslO [Betaproteobacteria bacterium]
MTDPAPTDLTQRFLLENLDIRGQVVRLGPVWRTILSRRDYPEALRPLLGEFAALTALIGAGLMHPGRAVLQVMGHGPISLAVADCTHDLHLRAMLRVDEKSPRSLGRGAGGEAHALHELFADGRLALTLENAETARQSQSIVPLEGATLSECFERYFDQSEQVPTHLWVYVTAEGVGALILQKLPGAEERDPNGWARTQFETARRTPVALARAIDGEGRGEGIADFLTALFPEDDVRLFKPLPVTDGCGRSEEKVVSMLLGLGRAEVDATLSEHGVVTVRDEICNQEYRFTAAEVARIFAS